MKILWQYFLIVMFYYLYYFSLHTVSHTYFFFFFLGFLSSTHISHSFPLSTFFFFFQFIPDHFFSYLSLFLQLSFLTFYFYLILEHSISLSHTNKFSLIHIDHWQRSGDRCSTCLFVFFFFCLFVFFFGLISFILLFRFHQAYEKDFFFVFQIFRLGFVFLF